MRRKRDSDAAAIAVVAPLSYMSIRTRLVKISKCYESNSIAVRFIGWRRTSDDVSTPFDRERPMRHLLRGGGYSNSALPIYYVAWTVVVLAWAAVSRPTRVHALGFESALPLAVLKKFRPALMLIYDDADRFSQSFPMPDAARGVIARLERWVAATADIHLIPTEARYPDGLSGSASVLENVPSRAALLRASDVAVERVDPDRLIVYVNGWLGEPRGARVLLEVAQRLDGAVSFLLAGRLSDESARRFAASPGVTNIGLVSNDVALAQYRAVDMVITFYDPALRINRLAAANKWGDCLATGTPFIVNQEVVTARPYVAHGMAESVPFGNAEVLADLLRALASDRDRLERLKAAARVRGASLSSFEAAYEEAVLARLQVTR